jgi:plastocyanin
MSRSELLTVTACAWTWLNIGDSMKKILVISATGLLSAIVGCGDVPDFGGGASIVPRVTYVPAAPEASDSATESAADLTETAVGTGSGVFTGKIVLTGSVNPLAALIQKGATVKDMEVCAAVETPDERLVLGDGNTVQGVFVYLNKAPKGGKQLEIPADAFLFDQKNCRFLPHCMIIPCGQLVKVLSADAVAHNTHTYPQKNPSVNSGVAPEDREGKLTFTYRKAESVPLSVKCDYHTWMTAYQLPIDHPYAAVTDENGQFTIPDLPTGKHSFILWHEAADGGFVERKLAVEIKSGETTEMQIDYPVEKLKL